MLRLRGESPLVVGVAGTFPAALVVGLVSGAILLGEAAMFATLAYR